MDDYYLRRAGLDYWEHLQWQAVDDWAELIAHLPAQRHWYFTKRAERLYTEPSYELVAVFVFGRESQGLPDDLLAARPQQCLRIPTRPQVRSLNLSNSVAVAIYEAKRQWDAK